MHGQAVKLHNTDIKHNYRSVICIKSKSVYSCNTRASSFKKFNMKHSRLSQRNSFTRFGAKIWNYFPPQMCKLHKPVFKEKIREAPLFAVLDTKELDTNVKAFVLLLKMNSYLTEIESN